MVLPKLTDRNVSRGEWQEFWMCVIPKWISSATARKASYMRSSSTSHLHPYSTLSCICPSLGDQTKPCLRRSTESPGRRIGGELFQNVIGLHGLSEEGHITFIPSRISSLSMSTIKSSREFSKSSEGCWTKYWSIGERSAIMIARESRARLPALPACCF